MVLRSPGFSVIRLNPRQFQDRTGHGCDALVDIHLNHFFPFALFGIGDRH